MIIIMEFPNWNWSRFRSRSDDSLYWGELKLNLKSCPIRKKCGPGSAFGFEGGFNEGDSMVQQQAAGRKKWLVLRWGSVKGTVGENDGTADGTSDGASDG